MVPNTPNILDQLLGGIGLPQTGVIGSPGIGQSGESPFGDLLGLLMGGGTGEEAGVGLLVAEPLDMVGHTAVREQVAAQIPSSGAATPQLIDPRILMFAEQGPASRQVTSMLSTEVPEEIDGGGTAATRTNWPGQPLLAYPDLRSITDAQQIEPTDGLFLVQESRVTDGNLEMVVIAQDDPSSAPVKITVPLDVLSTTVSGMEIGTVLSEELSMASRQASRVPLMPGPSVPTATPQSTQLSQLLAQVNVQSIEIQVETGDKADKSAATAQVQLRLAAEGSAAPVMIDARTAKANVSIVRESTTPIFGKTSENGLPNPLTMSNDSMTSGDEGAVREHIRPVAVLLQGGRQQHVFSLVENLSGGKDQLTADMSRQFVDPGIEKVGSTQETSASEMTRPLVRVTLAETVERPALNGNQSQTVMLKIDPEHLGPARLHLTVRHDVLTARVMVDSPMAKAAVEASLNQLTDQLHRAGIQVDRIDVELSGGGQENPFEQNAQWSQARRIRPFTGEHELNGEQDAAPLLARAVRTEYVGTSGVNLFA